MPQVTIECTGNFGDVAGDEGLLRQALLNLARNAAEACAEAEGGGRVTVRGEVIDVEEAGWQRVVVADNGPGIAQAAMAKLFRPFFTTKTNGTGLGLAVVQKIIVQHGGDRKSTRLNSSHTVISYAVFCLKKKKRNDDKNILRDG